MRSIRDIFRSRPAEPDAEPASPPIETQVAAACAVGVDDRQPPAKKAKRARRVVAEAPQMSAHGPVGLLAIQFPGCEVYCGDDTGDLIRFTILGKSTFRTVTVMRTEPGWQLNGTVNAILSNGRLEWYDGDFVDTMERTPRQKPIPAQWCLRDGNRTVFGMKKIYPK